MSKPIIETKRGPGGQSVKLPQKHWLEAEREEREEELYGKPAPSAQDEIGHEAVAEIMASPLPPPTIPAQELWTVEYVDSITEKWISPQDLRTISDVHNSAIAAAYEKGIEYADDHRP
jgi:hypothetical protein